jgi:hypothetical protein
MFMSPDARCNLGSFTQARQKARARPKEKDQVSKSTWKLVAKIQLSIPPFNLNLFNKWTPAMHRDWYDAKAHPNERNLYVGTQMRKLPITVWGRAPPLLVPILKLTSSVHFLIRNFS